MANQEQLDILKQGVEVWNDWRAENPDKQIDFSRADFWASTHRGGNLLEGTLNIPNLGIAFLKEGNFRGANFRQTNLRETDLRNANLSQADLREVDLRGANLSGAILKGANLWEADLGEANLSYAELTRTNLSGANFGKSQLIDADLSEASLTNSIFASAKMGYTIFRNSDLSKVIELENVRHISPSSISIDVLSRSEGRIPEGFLRGCGLSDWEIESAKLFRPNLSNEEINKILYKIYDLRANHAIQISPLFISYSHDDSTFVDKLESHLNKNGIRFWRDVYDMKSGRMEKQIDLAIRHNPTVLLILSEHSLKSDWVEHEVRTARAMEKEVGRDVLCPVALDGSWKNSPWPRRVMEQVMEYNILDFSEWKDDSKFGNTFNKLIDGLELFYKG